jgi:hypothetical protein
MVLQIHQFINTMPGQIERQQPVYLLDALGRHTPFHLEFVRSAEVSVQNVYRQWPHLIGIGSHCGASA